jgi:hypothetical protein
MVSVVVDLSGGNPGDLLGCTDPGLIRDQLITILIAARDTVSRSLRMPAGGHRS